MMGTLDTERRSIRVFAGRSRSIVTGCKKPSWQAHFDGIIIIANSLMLKFDSTLKQRRREEEVDVTMIITVIITEARRT